jgi:hypothetical protein
MENNRTEFLQELEAELASLKEKVRAFEDKLEAFRQLPQEETVEESDFTDMEIGVSDLPEQVVETEPVGKPDQKPATKPALEPVADRSAVDDARETNPHIAFGGGVHRCLGSHLARRELRVMLREWHRRIPEYEVKPLVVPEYAMGLRHVENLELGWRA